LIGSFVAFNILKVNPFNQMIGRDSRLASLFYDKASGVSGRASTGALSKATDGEEASENSGLTLQNLQLHYQVTQKANNRFLPKMNRLMH